jgi:hypothetical protein
MKGRAALEGKGGEGQGAASFHLRCLSVGHRRGCPRAGRGMPFASATRVKAWGKQTVSEGLEGVGQRRASMSGGKRIPSFPSVADR